MTDKKDKPRILVAEDDLVSRLMLVSAIQKWGYEPVAVDNGKDALEILSGAYPPLLAILDWVMPEMDGIDVVRTIRKNYNNTLTYIIMLTTKTEKEEVIEGLEAGADDYIRKPFDADELWARIRVGLRTAQLQKDLIEMQKVLEYEAVHDPLTGCLNRRGILERLKEELERSERTGEPLCVAMCDLDHFKKINDTYGHQTGDDVLKDFVHIIRSQLRPYDQIGRLGGEEFLIIIPNITEAYAKNTLERLNKIIYDTEVITCTGKVKITVSIGGIIVKKQTNIDSVIKQVDEALYTAKENGRNQVCFYGVIPNE